MDLAWAKNCTVAVADAKGEIQGTGFFISRSGLLLTSARVVEATGGWQQVRVQGQAVRPAYLGDSKRDDFVILQQPGYQGPAVPLGLTSEPGSGLLTLRYPLPNAVLTVSAELTLQKLGPHPDFSGLPMLHLLSETQQGWQGYRGAPVLDVQHRSAIGLMSAPEEKGPILAVPLSTVLEKFPTLPSLVPVPPLGPTPQSALPSAPQTKIFISYRSRDPDRNLAQQFHDALEAAGHEAFMAGQDIGLGEQWSPRIDAELQDCDYFLLLLSPQSAESEMVIEEVRRARELRDSRPDRRPVILPVRVDFPWSVPLSYDIGGYLNRIQQREWRSADDTSTILREVLKLITEGGQNVAPPAESEPTDEKQPSADQSLPTPSPTASPSSLPAAEVELELPGGQVNLKSAFYIERIPNEARCYETVLRPGALIRIKAPRQMGKTSLMARILNRSQANGCVAVLLSPQRADETVFTNLDKFLRWFCASVSRRLQLANRLEDYWDDKIFSSIDNCAAYFEEYLLARTERPLALGLDEVDSIFQYPEIAPSFLGMLRAWHEEAKSREIWQKLRLVVVHSTEIYNIPMNINQSPFFNIGLSVELSEFSPEQVHDLARRHGLGWSTAQVEQLMAMVGGHPHLVRVALYHLVHQNLSLTEFLAMAPTESGPYGDHLRQHLWNLQGYPELATAFRTVLAGTSSVRLDPELAFGLHSTGLVHLQGNEVTPRCDLYRQYFRERLRDD